MNFLRSRRSELKKSEQESDRGSNFAAFIAVKNVTELSQLLVLTHPEGKETINSDLSQEEADAIEAWYEQMDVYDYQGMADEIRFILKLLSKGGMV